MFFLTGCNIVPIEYNDSMLDGPVIRDTSFTDHTFLLSSHPELDTFNREKPVIICAHGYTATTFEWQEFRDYAQQDARAYTSLVALGGHGRSVEEFKVSTWEQWQAPVMEEFDALVSKGFKKISLAGSSTGGALLIEYLSRNAFDSKAVKPQEFYFIDAIVVPSSKLLHIVPLIGPILGNSPVEHESELEDKYWYTNRPTPTLDELNELIELVRRKLEKGITLPYGSHAKCYKSKIDNSADPVSSILIYKGLKQSDGNRIDVEVVDSDLHVFTRLAGRKVVSEQDSTLQKAVFKEMIDRVVE